MAEDKSRNLALIMLGIVALIAVVGLILLFTGAKTGKNVGVYQSGGLFYPSAREACLRAVQCQDGIGAVLVSNPNDNPAICVCPEHFKDIRLSDWPALRMGEMPAPREYPEQHYWKIIWKAQSSIYGDGQPRGISPVYEQPGTYPSGYYGDRRTS